MNKFPRAAKCIGMFLIGGLLNACAANSVLIRQDDQTFAKAQQQLQRTEKTVDEFKPEPSERSLFLQAESFYRYRFLPQQSTGKYMAEAAAAITDFPGFQSLAGSLDLEDLRFRAPDSAVQIWETLLELHPQTKLRPLILYRLGWAYRSVGARGLPRSSPDEAFDELIKDQPNSPLAAFAKAAKTIPWKSKETAAVRSLIPGFGQMYLGETRNGLVRLGIAVAALLAAAVPVYAAAHGGHNFSLKVAVGVVGLIVLSFDFTSSYEDTMRGVVRWNERAESEFNLTNPSAP